MSFNSQSSEYKHENMKKISVLATDAISVAVLIILDLYTKNIAVSQLKGKNPFILIPGVLEFLYLENKGAAFSMLTNHQGIFVFIALAAILMIAVVLSKLSAEYRYKPLRICLIMIASGAAGNLIDRIQLGYVRDFIYFSLINFPVFNVADCYVTVATALIVILVLFYYKDDDFSFLHNKH